MAVTSLASFKEAREKQKQKTEQLWKRQRYRYLGGSVRTAWQHHECDRCIFTILPGDQYQRDVYANYKYLRIEKHHWPQCYGPSEDEDREIREQIERDREREQEKASRKAA